MSGLIRDLVLDDGIEYHIAGVSGRGLFQPEYHGLALPAIGRDHGRRYRCRYKLWEDCLLLDALFLRSEVAPPPLEHREATETAGTESASGGFDYVYTELDLAVPYRGGLLLAREQIDEQRNVSEDHPAALYRTVVELMIEDGLVTYRADRSSRIAELRSRIAARSATVDQPNRVPNWQEAGFVRDYRR
jgi:hypothetical protein